MNHLHNDFPMLKKQVHKKPLVYFDSAATAQKPQAVIDAITNFYEDNYATVHRSAYELSTYSTNAYQNVREVTASFLHAKKSEEIIFTRGTTESINLVAYSFGKAFISTGDEILITEMEHHSNIVPWQIMCEDRKATLKVIPMDNIGNLDLKELERLITDKTKLVAVTHVSNSLGTLNPIKEIAALVHRSKAKILVDGAQSTPHMPIDVQDLDVDFFVFSGHKLYGPTGIGVLYGKEALLNAMPPYQGGGDMIDTVRFEKTTYAQLPMKFEAGTPMITEVIGLGAAIKYLNDIGMKNIENHGQELMHYATSSLEKTEHVRIIGQAQKKGPLISFVVNGLHPLDVGTMLDLQGIAIRTGHHCAQPVMRHFCLPGTARVSFGLYNTKEEIDYFMTSLKAVIKLLKQ